VKVATAERSLTVGRLMRRGLVGLVARGSQGALLAVAVRAATPEDAADLAIVLAVCTAVNLISNVGIPTLIIRSWRQGWDMRDRLALMRAYAWLSLAAGVLSALVIAALGAGSLAAIGGIVCFLQSAYYGAEYWALAKGNDAYDRFLGSAAAVQAASCLLAPIGAWLCHSVFVGLVFLTASFAAASLLLLLGTARVSFRQLLWFFARPHVERRWLEALGVGLASMTMAVVYNIDTIVLRFTVDANALAGYRLALLCVSFLVSLLPVNIFLLADVSTGNRTGYAKLALLGFFYVGCAAVLALVLDLLGERFEPATVALLVLSPLAFVRLMSQAVVSEMNARGSHRSVSGSYGLGILCWTVVAVLAGTLHIALWALASFQITVELAIMVALFVGVHRSRGRQETRVSSTPSALSAAP